MKISKFAICLVLLLAILFWISCNSKVNIDQATIEKQLMNLRDSSIQLRREALYFFYDMGKDAIPYLIPAIADTLFIEVTLVNPFSCAISIGGAYNCSGVLPAYTIELIIARDSICGDRNNTNSRHYFPVSGMDSCTYSNYIYWHGALTYKNEMHIEADDMHKIMLLYQKWWDENKDRPIEELRKEWNSGKRPLSNSDYSWN